MGCDIHAHLEIKVFDTWLHYNRVNIDRNYELFSHLAGVRSDGNIDPIAAPRGLPGDCSSTTSFDSNYFGIDGHSHSWISSEELKELERRMPLLWRWRGVNDGCHYCKAWGYLFGNTIAYFDKDNHGDFPPELQDIRLVFWFDN